MRLIDADDEKLRGKLMLIREAEIQINGVNRWRFAAPCIEAIDEAPTVELKPAWINCSLKLPECGKDVLIRFFSVGRVDIAHRISGSTGAYCWVCRDDFGVYDSKYVSDWAPIPET